MKSLGIAPLIRWPTVVRWAISVGLALLFLVVLLYGLREATLVRADPGILYVDGASGSDTTDCTDPANPCATIGYALTQAGDADTIQVAADTYTESLTLDKPVNLMGHAADDTIIHALSGQRVMTITGATITNSTVISGFTLTGGNPVADVGGGLLVITSSPTIRNNNIISNHAGAEGGGLYILDTVGGVVLISNKISGNRTPKSGGGLYFYRSPSAMLASNVISGNRGWRGGGSYFEKSPSATLSENTIVSNVAGDGCCLKYGGGLLIVQGDGTTLTGNTISNNLAWNMGGGLFVSACEDLRLDRNVISNNRGSPGGGLYHVGSKGTILTNTAVVDNQTNATGSGLHVGNYSSVRLLHTTIARNSGGHGSGVHIAGTSSTVAMTNTIVVSHSVGVTVTVGNTAALNGVLWYSNSIDYGGEGNITVTNAYTDDPAFAGDGYHLTASSMAIDRGVSGGVMTDIDGDPRPLDGVSISDIGADEFRFEIYLPIIFKNFKP